MSEIVTSLWAKTCVIAVMLVAWLGFDAGPGRLVWLVSLLITADLGRLWAWRALERRR